jgi:colicin import membrane protein
VELSAAFESQGAELVGLRVKLAEVEGRAAAAAAAAEAERVDTARQVAMLTDQAHTAMARVQEIEKRAEDLSRALDLAHGTEQRLTLELEAERKTLGVLRETLNALHLESATVKARAEAQAGVQADQAERLKRLEAELAAERGAAAAAREEAAKLTGQAQALTAQHAELMRVIEGREGERPGPKGKK